MERLAAKLGQRCWEADSINIVDILLKISAVIGALGAICALLIRAFKWAMAPQTLTQRIKRLEEKEEADRKSIQKENAMICYGLSACLDGLSQLGANHSVTDAKDCLEKYINLKAHD